LNGAKPDFIVLRPQIGILIVSVFDEYLPEKEALNNGNDSVSIKNKNDNSGCLSNPISTLSAFQNAIIGGIAELTDAVIENVSNLGVVKKLLICTKYSTEETNKYFGKDTNYTAIYGNDFVKSQGPYAKLFFNIGFNTHKNLFDDFVLRRLTKLLSPTWHSYREGKMIKLTTPQRVLAISKANTTQKISGVAGSGKTLVMCTRAINAVKRTGGQILILTFNIALKNYIRIRLSEVREDYSWSNIELDSYHRFFRKQAYNCNLQVRLKSYDDMDFFASKRHNLKQYDSIFIDEAQDFKNEWISLLKNVFLKSDGEFVVFGDPTQNIYHREIGQDGDIKIGTIPGTWNKSLTKSERFLCPALFELGIKFKQNFRIGKIFEDRLEPQQQHTKSEVVEYCPIPAKDDMSCIAKAILDVIYPYINYFTVDRKLSIKDIAILSAKIDILQEVDSLYKHKNNAKTTLTFINKEQNNLISRNSIIASWGYKKDYDRKDSLIKNIFTTDTPYLKLSTIQSFKGWDAQTVFLIIMPELKAETDDRNQSMHGYDSEMQTAPEQTSHYEYFNSPELIYTGITRARENLVIINVGYDIDDVQRNYHNFFKTNLQR
jgi:hypothetical protein